MLFDCPEAAHPAPEQGFRGKPMQKQSTGAVHKQRLVEFLCQGFPRGSAVQVPACVSADPQHEHVVLDVQDTPPVQAKPGRKCRIP